jgi:hypothetical protein
MKRTLQAVFLTVFAAQALIVGQSADVKRVLADIRTALGGETKLAQVTSVDVAGRTTRPMNDGTAVDQDFEMAFEMPAGGAIKFVKKDAVMSIGSESIFRRSGFNGDELIDVTDMPPSMNGNGNVRMTRTGPGGPAPNATPDQIAAQKQQRLASSRREFARLVLGMIGTTTSAYPVEFTYGGKVDAAGGKAEVLELKAADGFAGKLFVDAGTHLPLMLSWMDKEPVRVTMGDGGSGGTMTTMANGATMRTVTAGGGMSQDDLARMQQDMAARLKEAEANRKTVEFRIFYADYKSVDGVKLPTRIQKMADGMATEELTLEKIKINGKVDPARFAIAK